MKNIPASWKALLSFLLLFLLPATFLHAQIWKKILSEKENKPGALLSREQEDDILKSLQNDIKNIASDQMEGRLPGSKGEGLAGMYIGQRMNNAGLVPYGSNFKHPFKFISGKEFTPETRFAIDRKFIFIPEEAFPAPFSAAGEDDNYVLPESEEPNAPWLIPLYETPQQANDPHFDWLKNTYQRATRAVERGATSIVFYDSYGSKFAPVYTSQSNYPQLKVPVVVMLKKAYDAHIKDLKVMRPFYINIKFRNEYQYATNIIGYINNNAPSTVIIGAHYDGLGHGEGLKTGNRTQDVYNGADDNASGVAAMLSLARLIGAAKFKQYNYIFLAFSASEPGLLGARAFVDDRNFNRRSIAFMVNLDMVGRLNTSRDLYISGTHSSIAWNVVLRTLEPHFHLLRDNEQHTEPSDYIPFYEDSIPVLSFSTGLHADYHTPADNLKKINVAGEKDIVVYVYNLLDAMEKRPVPLFATGQEKVAAEPVVPAQQAPVAPAGSANPIGITIDESYEDIGVRIAGAADGQAAARAGLKADDILLQVNGVKVNTEEDYRKALNGLKHGQKIPVKVKRGPTVQSFTLVY